MHWIIYYSCKKNKREGSICRKKRDSPFFPMDFPFNFQSFISFAVRL